MKIILSLVMLILGSSLAAQDMSYSRSGNMLYKELPNPAETPLEEWMNLKTDINVSFANDNIRYPKERVPEVNSSEWNVKAWKGEKIHNQILVWTKKNLPRVRIIPGDLVTEKGSRIKSDKIRAGFVRYVMTDEFGEGCDNRTPDKYSSSLVGDPIDIVDVIDVQPSTVQPIWVSINVPSDIEPGVYRGMITVDCGTKFDLSVSLTVADHILPPPSEWKFDLDLWQNPDPVAKVHDVSLWSDDHYRLMRQYYEMLASAGQKSITAFIIDQPWGPDHVYYRDPAFIKWTRKKNGVWAYDYSVFDRYVKFVMSCGIDQRINCYSMITWDLKFIYFDEAKGDTVSVYAKPGTQEYNDLWEPMIRDFTKHLKLKGWFEKTTIAMDERDMEGMKAVMALLKRVDPGWKTALAGNYHREIATDIYDYCVVIHARFDEDIHKARKEAGMPTTYYTACGENRPNSFTFSPPAENVWISWYAAAEGFTGYLRWAYNNWTEAPLQDTRYKTWPAGDCYQVYPGPRSSVRFEKLIEGIQDFEKIRILKEKFIKAEDKKNLNELGSILDLFTLENIQKMPASDMVNRGKAFICEF
jgi:hypothetical protein